LKVLLHICCAPCAVYPLEVLEDEGSKVFGFFYNPNIHPYQEYRRRLETVEQFAGQAGLEVIYRDEYDVVSFLREVAFRESSRCHYCHPAVQQEAGSPTGSPARRGSGSGTWDPIHRSRFTSRLARRYPKIERTKSLSAAILWLYL
jgi:hypothetical protein